MIVFQASLRGSLGHLGEVVDLLKIMVAVAMARVVVAVATAVTIPSGRSLTMPTGSENMRPATRRRWEVQKGLLRKFAPTLVRKFPPVKVRVAWLLVVVRGVALGPLPALRHAALPPRHYWLGF